MFKAFSSTAALWLVMMGYRRQPPLDDARILGPDAMVLMLAFVHAHYITSLSFDWLQVNSPFSLSITDRGEARNSIISTVNFICD